MPIRETASAPKRLRAYAGSVLLFWFAVLLASIPGTVAYLAGLPSHDRWITIPAILLALTGLVANRWDRVLRMPSSVFSVILVAMSLALGAYSGFRFSPALSALGFLLAATACLRSQFPFATTRQSLVYLAWLPLMLVRFPAGITDKFLTRMSGISGAMASWLLDAMDVVHYVRQDVLEISGGPIFVSEVCKGTPTLSLLLMLTMIWFVVFRRPAMMAPVYWSVCAAWLVAVNAIHVTIVALGAEWYEVDPADPTMNRWLGVGSLALAMLMILSTDRLLAIASNPVPETEAGRLSNPLSMGWNWLMAWGTALEKELDSQWHPSEMDQPGIPPIVWTKTMLWAAMLFAVPIASLGVLTTTMNWTQAFPMPAAITPWAESTEMDELLARYALIRGQSLQSVDEHRDLKYTDVWSGEFQGSPILISISQPYQDWHDLRRYYTANDWRVQEWNAAWRNVDANDPMESPSIARALFTNSTGVRGHLFFDAVDGYGGRLGVPLIGAVNAMYRSDTDLENRAKEGAGGKLMLQLWYESAQPISDDQLFELGRRFHQFRSVVQQSLTWHKTKYTQADFSSSNTPRRTARAMFSGKTVHDVMSEAVK
ncbi:exosortase U [Stieleria varia]|uniref:Transmembrane exosortase n=1 Tax=Stieleria varia TaxID=2528005 RepID=A0A5C6B270_9BACT|nr:exosortase U [Stieleria varia]TWU05937.1 Transmembrane exosortase [Stieleria varia]